MHAWKTGSAFATRRGFTVVELLVVIGIISILIGLILPAVQAARESARLAQCENNVRQMALACLNHESASRELPGGGWGYAWVGDPTLGSGKTQPGGWIFQILPYMEQANIREFTSEASPLAARASMLERPIAVFICPSRPLKNPSPFLGQIPFRNADRPQDTFKSDYAANGGDVPLRSDPGPTDGLLSTLRAFRSAHTGKATGLVYQMSTTRLHEITDGLSNTYLIGEKYVQIPQPTNPEVRDFGNDQAALIGDDHDIRRWTAGRPRADRSIANSEVFGSSHRSGWNAAMADGSVRTVAFGLDGELHRHLGNRADAQTVEVPE